MKMKDIPGYNNFTKIEPVKKGYSGQEKYYIETDDSLRLLLKIADADGYWGYESKKKLFDIMKKFAALKISMCDPIDFGLCNNGKSSYLIVKWCEGSDLESIITSLSETTRYTLGKKAGEILRKIHSVQLTEEPENWHGNYIKGAYGVISEFKKTSGRIEGSDTIFHYFENNNHLINNRPLSYVHNDYHTGNFMISKNDDLAVVDWDMCGCGDPWEDFSAINNADVFPHFTTGLVRGYFGGEPPSEFWNVTALYLSIRALSCVNWAMCYPESLESCVKNVNDTLIWYDNMKNPVPTWYLKDFNTNM